MPPVTLTRKQFKAKRPQGSYNSYLRYVTAARSKPKAKPQSLGIHAAPKPKQRPIDPFAAPTEAQLAQRALGLFGPSLGEDEIARRGAAFGPGMSDEQIQTQAGERARAQINPLLQSIMAEIQKRSAAEQTNLRGATQNYAQLVGQFAPQVKEAYAGAEQSQAGVNAALSQALAGGGQQLSGELAQKLGAINAPGAQVEQVAGGAASDARGAGNAQLGIGSAELGRLIGNSSAAQEYGAKLPGIAGAQGLQRSAEIAGKYADELDSRTGEVTASLPGLIQDLIGSMTSREDTRRQNVASLQENQRDRETKRREDVASFQDSERNRALQGAIAKTSGLVDVTRANASVANAQISRQRARESARHNRTTEQQRTIALQQTARSLGISVARLKEMIRSHSINEQTAAQRAKTQSRSERERERHNRVQEKKKPKTKTAGSKPPWSK